MFFLFSLYLILHFISYVLWIREIVFFRTEKGIFLYHLISVLVSGFVGATAGFLDPVDFGLSGFVLFISLHGIYSISFLELWSLAQGGYSISIIAEIARAEQAGVEPDFVALAGIGQAKQVDRISALERLGLIARSEVDITLTSRGKIMAAILFALSLWVAPSKTKAD